MRCPYCGTMVKDGASICPACHHQMARRLESQDDGRWCESCGSSIPDGMDACPECGMPVEGAFDDGLGERLSLAEVQEDDLGDTGFVSAIPPEPLPNEDMVPPREQRRYIRIVLLSLAAALLFVGGITLYIARPWNPEAYSTHATQDADTSMEGFPGERTYLVSQDRAQEAEREAYVAGLRKTIDDYAARLPKLAAALDDSYEEVSARIAQGYVMEGDTAETDFAARKEEINSVANELAAMEIEDETVATRRDKVLVLVGYLQGAADVLENAWSALHQQSAAAGFSNNLSYVLEGGAGTRSYAEWRELFDNAYGSSGATRQE